MTTRRKNDIIKRVLRERDKVFEIVGYLEELAREKVDPPAKVAWVRRLAEHLASLERHLKAHFKFEETGGFMEEVLSMIPNADLRVERLKSDHGALLATTANLLKGANNPAHENADSGSLCQELSQFLSRLRHHEHEEIDLVQQAFLDDVGSLD
ncbi:MAG: hemerythrin domain-containing protein [Acidobacteriota bacterium]